LNIPESVDPITLPLKAAVKIAQHAHQKGYKIRKFLLIFNKQKKNLL